MIAETLEQLIQGRSLDERASEALINAVMNGEAEPAQIAGLLVALRAKGETVDELVGAARAMRAHAVRVTPQRTNLIDTAGTGGDGSGTFNISTTAALIAAAGGAAVAKHGNRAASSRSGAADLLEALGVGIELSPELAAACIDEVGFGYLHAPAHHPAMRHAGPVRRALGVRTIFNLLGPLTNPAGARRQVIGVAARDSVEPIAQALHRLGCEHGLVVHGEPGIDELSPVGLTLVATVTPAGVELGELDARELGLPRCTLADLRGGDAADNARITEAIFAGEPGPPADAACLNAGAALFVSGVSGSLADGLALARTTIASGAAHDTLERLRAFTR